jgi:hypothetical protein
LGRDKELSAKRISNTGKISFTFSKRKIQQAIANNWNNSKYNFESSSKDFN